MKQKPLFNLNILQNCNSEVYFILPELSNMTIDILGLCVEFVKIFHHLTFLVSDFELSFYKLIVSKSKSFSEFRGKINVESSSTTKIKEIQLKDCIITNLSSKPVVVETFKRAILCSPNEYSDLVFCDNQNEQNLTVLQFLKNFLLFIQIKDATQMKNIELNPSDVINASHITCNLTNKKYNVIIMNDMLTSLKVVNTLKKNKLKKHLIVISKNPVGITDPKLLSFREYCFLDMLAFFVQAENIYCPKSLLNKSIISNLRINLSVFSNFKDYAPLLFDITEPIINDKNSCNRQS